MPNEVTYTESPERVVMVGTLRRSPDASDQRIANIPRFIVYTRCPNPATPNACYGVRLLNGTTGQIIVETAELLTKEEVFGWLLNHRDW